MVGLGALCGDAKLAAVWIADALEGDKKIPLSYLGKAGYAAGYIAAVLAIGLALFEDRELS